MPYLAVPLGDRHIVYRSLLDHQFAEFCRHVCTFVLDPAENTNTSPPLARRILPHYRISSVSSPEARDNGRIEHRELTRCRCTLCSRAPCGAQSPSTTTLPLIF